METVCAELAYWRHRFILDSAGLAKDDSELLTLHTLFQTRINGRSMDLTEVPWVAGRAQWTHGADYSRTQAAAAEARVHGVEWIRYESVRCPGTHCAAVLGPRALRTAPPYDMQDWVCKATRARVIVTHMDGASTFSWDF